MTAEHVNTGTVAELIVNVDTLQDKLFLFQFTPAVETTLRYTNGDGVQKEVTSMADGRAAIYEESGIQGDVYLESQQGDTEYFGTLYNENLVSSEKDSTQLELYPVNYMTLRKAAQVPIYLKKPDGTPYLGEVTVHGGVYLNDAYAPDARLDTDDSQGYNGKEGYTVDLAQDNGAHTFVFDMTQFSTEGRDVGTDPVDASDNLQFVFQMEAEGYYPLLVRVNGNINEEDAIATGERIITLEEAPVDSETDEVVKEPFAAVQTLYYGENKYGYSDDVKGRKGKLGPGDTYSDLELETLTLWWGQEKSESGMSLRFEDQFGITPKNQSCQILNYPFTTMPVTIHSWQLNKDTMSGWLDTLEGAGLNMVYTDSQGQQVKREDPGFRIINMLGAGDAADEDTMLRLMRETALKSTSNGEGRIDVANALVSTGIALATTYNIGTDMDMLTMKIVPTADPTVFRGIFLAGINNMIDDNVTGIDPDTSQKDDLDYMPGFADLKNIASMGASGWATDAKNRTENAQKLLKNHATTRNRENNISYMLKGGFETEIYYDYDAGAWKMVVVTGQLNVGGGFGMSWNFNSFCGPVPVTAQLAFGVALDVQFAAAVDRTQMANDYLTQVQLNAFIRAFGGIGFDYAILAMKIGLFGQLSFQGAVRFLNAIGEAQAKVGYKIDFLGEVGIEFLIKFLFITYERVLWSQKIQIPSIQDNNWDAIDAYWEEVQQGNSDNEYEIITPGETQQASLTASQQPELLAADSSTGVALYGAPSTATLESRDYLESPRTYGGSLQVLRARAQTLAENTTSTGYQELIGNSYTLENGTPTGLIQLDGEGVATVQPITFNQKGAGVAYRFGGEPDRSQHGPYGDCPVPNPPAHGGWDRGRGHHHLSGDRRRLPDRNHLDGASGIPARHRDSKRQTLRCKRHRQPHLQPACGHHHLGHCCHLRGQDPHLPRGNHPSLHRRRHRRRWLHPVPHHRAGGRPRHRQRQPQPGFQRPDRDHHRHPRRGLQGGQRHCKAAQRLHCACHRPGQRQVYLHHAQRRRHRGCDLHPRGLALCGRHRGQVVLRRRGLRLPAGHYGGYERNYL